MLHMFIYIHVVYIFLFRYLLEYKGIYLCIQIKFLFIHLCTIFYTSSPTERMILAGGYGGFPQYSANYTGHYCNSDVWQFDGATWTLLIDPAGMVGYIYLCLYLYMCIYLCEYAYIYVYMHMHTCTYI